METEESEWDQNEEAGDSESSEDSPLEWYPAEDGDHDERMADFLDVPLGGPRIPQWQRAHEDNADVVDQAADLRDVESPARMGIPRLLAMQRESMAQVRNDPIEHLLEPQYDLDSDASDSSSEWSSSEGDDENAPVAYFMGIPLPPGSPQFLAEAAHADYDYQDFPDGEQLEQQRHEDVAAGRCWSSPWLGDANAINRVRMANIAEVVSAERGDVAQFLEVLKANIAKNHSEAVEDEETEEKPGNAVKRIPPPPSMTAEDPDYAERLADLGVDVVLPMEEAAQKPKAPVEADKAGTGECDSRDVSAPDNGENVEADSDGDGYVRETAVVGNDRASDAPSSHYDLRPRAGRKLRSIIHELSVKEHVGVKRKRRRVAEREDNRPDFELQNLVGPGDAEIIEQCLQNTSDPPRAAFSSPTGLSNGSSDVSIPAEPCRACGANEYGGAPVCAKCVSFFRRKVLRDDQAYACPRSGCCLFDEHCLSCRFTRCRELGLSEQKVLTEDEKSPIQHGRRRTPLPMSMDMCEQAAVAFRRVFSADSPPLVLDELPRRLLHFAQHVDGLSAVHPAFMGQVINRRLGVLKILYATFVDQTMAECCDAKRLNIFRHSVLADFPEIASHFPLLFALVICCGISAGEVIAHRGAKKPIDAFTWPIDVGTADEPSDAAIEAIYRLDEYFKHGCSSLEAYLAATAKYSSADFLYALEDCGVALGCRLAPAGT